MLNRVLALVALIAACAAPVPLSAQVPSTAAGETVTPMWKFIIDAFRAQSGDTLCMLGDAPVAKVDEFLRHHLRLKAGDAIEQDRLEEGLLTLFPCPFSPYRAELIPASAKDVQGAWLFPYDSQPFRFGPQSPLQPKTPKEAVSCEVVGLFPQGEYRTGAVIGSANPCRFSKASDLDPARKRPALARWAMGEAGKVTITRSDMPNYVEEWDFFVATKSFRVLSMDIRAGDLLAYRRKERASRPAASTEFRHLQRLE